MLCTIYTRIKERENEPLPHTRFVAAVENYISWSTGLTRGSNVLVAVCNQLSYRGASIIRLEPL